MIKRTEVEMAAHELIQKLDDAETNNGKKAKNVDTREKRKAAEAEDVEEAVRSRPVGRAADAAPCSVGRPHLRNHDRWSSEQ